MATPGSRLHTEPLESQPQTQPWSFAAKLAFRFCLVYFGLYCLGTQLIGALLPLPKGHISDPSMNWPIRQGVTWIAVHVFAISRPLAFFTGSGDSTFAWVLQFCFLVVSLLATAVWSVVDRGKEDYVDLHKWFRLFLRFALAGEMLVYGLGKIFPLQMPYPSLSRLLEPLGNFSPMGVLWSSIGAAPAYEIFTGAAELLGGILLIVPCTTTLGALVCLADLAQVFTLNMAYDVPVKLLSFHLLLISLFLLAPDLPRLANLFLLNRGAEPSRQPPLFASRRDNRLAVAAQLVFGMWLLGMGVYGSWSAWQIYGGGRPKSVLYGIWNIDQFVVDGQVRPPLLTDSTRWRRVIFEFPARMAFQRPDDSTGRYNASINTTDQTLALTKDADPNWKAEFAFRRPAPTQLILDGDMDRHKVHMQLELVDRSHFLLVSRGFHWVQDYPFNR